MPGYRAKKRLGQNFLTNKTVVARLIEQIEPSSDDTIVEIGSGRGALTLPLAESGAQLLAVEFDRDLIGYLTKLMSRHHRVQVIDQDFLTFDPDAHGLTRFKLIGNLPYNITTPVIDWCVKHHERLEVAVLMVQKELAARLAAEPGTRDWSPLSIFTRMAFEVEDLFDVSPKHFRPPPQVTSGVIRMTPTEAWQGQLTKPFQVVVRAAFKQRRKLLTNNLVPDPIPDSDMARLIVEEVGLPPSARAESITIEQFLNLTALLVERKLV